MGVKGFKGKCLCIVFYPQKDKFTLGVKAFAAAQEKFNKEDCVVIACTADSNWSTWSTSLGLTLKGVWEQDWECVLYLDFRRYDCNKSRKHKEESLHP